MRPIKYDCLFHCDQLNSNYEYINLSLLFIILNHHLNCTDSKVQAKSASVFNVKTRHLKLLQSHFALLQIMECHKNIISLIKIIYKINSLGFGSNGNRTEFLTLGLILKNRMLKWTTVAECSTK